MLQVHKDLSLSTNQISHRKQERRNYYDTVATKIHMFVGRNAAFISDLAISPYLQGKKLFRRYLL